MNTMSGKEAVEIGGNSLESFFLNFDIFYRPPTFLGSASEIFDG